MDRITVSDASRITKLTPGRISNLIFSGVLEPQHRVPSGSGDYSVLGERNIRELMLVERLGKVGMKLDMIRNIIKLISESSLDWWKEDNGHVVVLKDSWFLTTNPFSRSNQEVMKSNEIVLITKI